MASEEPRAVHLQLCRLKVVQGSMRGREWRTAAEVIRAGKAADNELVLPDETVSRVHFELVRDLHGTLVRDLRSTNGTFLDGAEIREAYLRPGSVITAGAVRIRFHPIDERIAVRPSPRARLESMVGVSAAMRELFALAERIAPTEATVLIEGETGAGRTLLAQTLHRLSERRDGALVTLACARLPGAALEVAMLGQERGAGPGSTHQGAFEQAHGGTLVIEEPAELPPAAQERLARVLELREVTRVGSTRAVRVDVRVLASCTRDPRDEVERGRLREDLRFRLARVELRLAPLRERKEDIPALVESFAAARRAAGRAAADLPADAQEFLARCDWPGNVAELRAVVERILDGEHAPRADVAGVMFSGLPYSEAKSRTLRGFESAYLRGLLQHTGGNISRAAREAAMDRKHLYKLLRRHGLR